MSLARWPTRMLLTGAGLIALTTAGALAASPAFASSATLYVGGAGCSDTGQGSQAQPYCTIGAAATAATAGQTVLVAAGTYSERVSVAHSGTPGNPIVFQAAPGASVVVTGSSNGFAVPSRSYVTISGFSVTGTSSYGIYVSSSNHIVISGNTVTYAGHPVSGQIAAGVYLSGTTASTVTGNVSDHNSDSGFYLNTSSSGNTVSYNEASWNANGYQRNANGINVVGQSNTILGNVLHDNEDSGIQFYTGGNNNLATLNVSYNNGDHGIDDLNVTGGRIIGNTIYHNCTSGINVEGTSGNYLVANNIAIDNAVYPAYHGIACNRRAGNIGIWDSAPASTTVDNNLVYLSKAGAMYVFGSSFSSLGAMQAATGQEQHGLQRDPLFVNATGGDLRLQEGSPAIDSADSGVSGEQAADIAGTPRTDDPGVANTGLGIRDFDDRGAYERHGSDGGPLPPTAALSVNPTSGSAPLPVTADASASTDPQGQALSYTFAFGDGTSAGPQSTATADHTYANAGNYTITVTVTNTANLSSTAQASVTVTGLVQSPVAALSVNPTSGSAPLPVTADASASTDPQGQALSYTFAYGDGTSAGPQSTATANHTYANAGNYTITVTVTNTANLSSTAQATVTVQAAGGGGSPSYVSQIATNYSTSTHTSGSITVWRSDGVAAGHVELLTVQLTGTAPTGAVTGSDDAGNTLTVAADVADANGDRLIVLYGNVNTGLVVNNKITVTFPSAATYRIIGDELSGVTSLDRSATAVGNGGSFASGPTATTTSPSEFVFGTVSLVGGASPTWASGWTGLTTYAVGSNYLGRSYQIPSATGSFNASGTGAGSWLAICVTLR